MDEYGEYDEDLTGLSIVGEDDIFGDANDPAAMWLAAQAESGKSESDILVAERDMAQESLSFRQEGAMTAADLQLGRIGHLEPRIQRGIQAALMGQSIDGINPVDLAAAREQFTSEIGIDPKVFAGRIKLDEYVQVPRHRQDLAQIQSVLAITSSEYLERGPGSKLPGNIYGEDKQDKADTDLKQAFAHVSAIADVYLDDRTRGTSVEPARRQALEESIYRRLMEGTFYEGSKDLLPLPNETGVTGIVRTQGIYGSNQGTPLDRVQAAKYDSAYRTVEGTGNGQRLKFQRDDFGGKIFKDAVSPDQRTKILRETPSLANSLFPKPKPARGQKFTAEERAKQSRDQKFQMGQLQFKADEARRILRKEMPTNRDESAGQIRMSGFDRPIDEQAVLQNLRNEAAIEGVTWADQYAGQQEGEQRSELDDYIEEATNTIKADTIDGSPTQGTQEWLNQRKGKITASTAAGLLKPRGIEERALELAMERLGTGEKFAGNADTREGNEGEDKALRAFMAGPGRKYEMREAFFEENPDIAGFGVSPDGRLYNQEGETEGLLELKYLSSGSMKDAAKKYTPQMQMQMAVTGESQTNFFALDKFTGEYVHQVVQADPNMQAELIQAGTAALAMAEGLDNRGVQQLRNQLVTKKPRQPLVAPTGQKTSFTPPSAQVEEPMQAFRPEEVLAEHTVSGMSGAAGSLLAERMKQEDQRERSKEALANARASDVDVDKTIEAHTVSGTGGASKTLFAQQMQKADQAQRLKESMNASDELLQAKEEEAKASKDNAAATKAAALATREFRQALGDTLNIAADIGGIVTGGNESVMNEVRFAAESGYKVEVVRGTRKALEMGGLNEQGINAAISSSATQAKGYNDAVKAAAQFTALQVARGQSNLAEVRNTPIPALLDLKQMNPSELIQETLYMMEGKSPQAKAQIATMMGVPTLATYVGDPDAVMIPDEVIDETGARDTTKGIQTIKQTERNLRETAGSLGEEVGTVSAGAVAVNAALGGAAGGAALGAVSKLGSKLGGKLPSPSSLVPKASTMQSVANAARSGTMQAGKFALNAAKANPASALALAIPAIARATVGVEDDGSYADSFLDVLDFAAGGAALGSVVPGVGTAIGAGAGTAVGIANEAYEYFFGGADDKLPKADIGPMSSQTNQSQATQVQDVNVTVTNEISPELIRTTTDVNGEVDVDEDTGLSTGG